MKRGRQGLMSQWRFSCHSRLVERVGVLVLGPLLVYIPLMSCWCTVESVPLLALLHRQLALEAAVPHSNSMGTGQDIPS